MLHTQKGNTPMRTISRPAPMRATPEQREQVVHITWGSDQYTRWQGVVTGIIMSQDEVATTLQMYSAGCVHNVVAIPTAEIMKVVPYGH